MDNIECRWCWDTGVMSVNHKGHACSCKAGQKFRKK